MNNVILSIIAKISAMDAESKQLAAGRGAVFAH